MGRTSLSKLQPLWVGRLSRVLAGGATMAWTLSAGVGALGPLGWLVLMFLGVSFLVGGLLGNPGCEITALPNLFLRPEKRLHSV